MSSQRSAHSGTRLTGKLCKCNVGAVFDIRVGLDGVRQNLFAMNAYESGKSWREALSIVSLVPCLSSGAIVTDRAVRLARAAGARKGSEGLREIHRHVRSSDRA